MCGRQRILNLHTDDETISWMWSVVSRRNVVAQISSANFHNAIVLKSCCQYDGDHFIWYNNHNVTNSSAWMIWDIMYITIRKAISTLGELPKRVLSFEVVNSWKVWKCWRTCYKTCQKWLPHGMLLCKECGFGPRKWDACHIWGTRQVKHPLKPRSIQQSTTSDPSISVLWSSFCVVVGQWL